MKDKETTGNRTMTPLVPLLLAAAVLAVYWQVSGYDFVNFDDPTYVEDNASIARGLTSEGVKWAFTTVYASNWHPLTWISHMADVQFFGLSPGPHHMTNVIIHLLNSILLFLVLFGMTGARWRSAVVAALFALHPLHVESVAWISERKDVLSAFFWMLTMATYLWYARGPSVTRYLAMAGAFILGLLSKPMLVTLPFALLLLDYWPLGRIARLPAGEGGGTLLSGIDWPKVPRAFLEKAPLIVLAALSSGVTVYAQKTGGAMQPFELLPFGVRVMNSIVAYGMYLWKTVLPLGLSVFYPYPGRISLPELALSLAFVLLVTFWVVKEGRKRPFLPVGWFWYLVTLLPVIGIVQVGAQSMADRYTYIPLIGVFIIVVWGLGEAASRLRSGGTFLGALSAVILVLLSELTWVQVGFWKNSTTLFRHTLVVTANNDLAHFNLGHALEDDGDFKGAIEHYQAAIRISPTDVPALASLGALLADMGRAEEGIGHLRQALAIDPGYSRAMGNLGNILLRTGKTDQAIEQYRKALEADPEDAEISNNLGAAYMQKGDVSAATACFREALRLKPGFADAAGNLEKALAIGARAEADTAKLERLIREHPGDPGPYLRLAALKGKQGKTDDAIALYEKVLKIQPVSLPALSSLAMIYSGRKDYTKALAMLEALRKLRPDDPDILYNIACIHALRNMPEESVSWLRKAIRKGFGNIGMIRTDPDLASIRDTEFVKNLAISAPAGKKGDAGQ